MNRVELQSQFEELNFELSQALEECTRAYDVWQICCERHHRLEAQKREILIKLLEAVE